MCKHDTALPLRQRIACDAQCGRWADAGPSEFSADETNQKAERFCSTIGRLGQLMSKVADSKGNGTAMFNTAFQRLGQFFNEKLQPRSRVLVSFGDLHQHAFGFCDKNIRHATRELGLALEVVVDIAEWNTGMCRNVSKNS